MTLLLDNIQSGNKISKLQSKIDLQKDRLAKLLRHCYRCRRSGVRISSQSNWTQLPCRQATLMWAFCITIKFLMS